MAKASRGPQRRPLADDELDALFEDFELLAHDGRVVSARVLLERIEGELSDEDAELWYARGLLAWAADGPDADARAALVRAVELAPEFADARHALGRLADLQGDFETLRTQWLEVLRLDQAQVRRRAGGAEDKVLLDAVESTAREVLAELPAQFRDKLHNVPIVLEERPHPSLVESGFDPRALGLFEGLEDSMRHEVAAAPTRIVLFYENLLDAFDDPRELAQEVEITLLHEIGHFFGLDEDEVADLGLA